MNEMKYKKFFKGKQKETAIEAVNRYKTLTTLLSDSSEDNKSYLVDFYQIHYHYNNWHHQLTSPEMKMAFMKEKFDITEQKWDLQLPKDYKKFMMAKGPFMFGKQDHGIRLLYPPLSETIMDVAVSDDYYESMEKAKEECADVWQELQQRIVLIQSRDDFNYLSYYINSEAKEMSILRTGQDDWLGYKVADSFNELMVEIINEQIECIFDELEITA